jgi:hypothetical protein
MKSPEDFYQIYPFQVTPEFFQAMGIPPVRGRNLLPGERHAVIVTNLDPFSYVWAIGFLASIAVIAVIAA